MTDTDLSEHFTLLADHVLHSASAATRRPKRRAVVPEHRPSVERDRRLALPADSPRCSACGCRVYVAPTAGGPCAECGWPL